MNHSPPDLGILNVDRPYSSKASALNAIESIKKNGPAAPIEENIARPG